MKRPELTYQKLAEEEAALREAARQKRAVRMRKPRGLWPIPTKEEKFNYLMSRGLKTDSGCIEFQGSRSKDGYGCINFGKEGRAHRLAWVLAGNTIPAGMIVCHHCDNPPCMNPDHLFIGTDADNTHDSMKKGRFHKAKGEKNGLSKLTADQVRYIRETYNSNRVNVRIKRGTLQRLVEELGVTGTTICLVARGGLWSHVQ